MQKVQQWKTLHWMQREEKKKTNGAKKWRKKIEKESERERERERKAGRLAARWREEIDV